MFVLSKKKMDELQTLWDEQDKKKDKKGKDKDGKKGDSVPKLQNEPEAKPAAEKALSAVD